MSMQQSNHNPANHSPAENTPECGVSDYAENSILSQFRLPTTLPENFYPQLVTRILPFCGNEYETADFHSAIKVLNHELRLRLNPDDEQVFGLLLTGLAQAHRFYGNVHIAESLGENSAVHSCHTMILLNELFRRSELLDAKNQTPEVAGMRIEMTLSALVHDMGEILGEFNSVSQRTMNQGGDVEEDPLTERDVFEVGAKLALKAVHEQRPDQFYAALQQMRTEAKASRTSAGMSHAKLKEVVERYQNLELPEELQGKLDSLLALYDLAELKGAASSNQTKLFRGYGVKLAEHLQGSRHYLRFSTKSEVYERINLFSPHSPKTSVVSSSPRIADERALTVPFDVCGSPELRGSLSYIEGEVGHVCSLARTPAEKKLAATMRDSMYLTIAELLNAMNPIFDRNEKKIPRVQKELMLGIQNEQISPELRRGMASTLNNLLNERREELLHELRNLRANTSPDELRTHLLDIETRQRMMSLYLKAYEKRYVPQPGEKLFQADRIPEQLLPLDPIRLNGKGRLDLEEPPKR